MLFWCICFFRGGQLEEVGGGLGKLYRVAGIAIFPLHALTHLRGTMVGMVGMSCLGFNHAVPTHNFHSVSFTTKELILICVLFLQDGCGSICSFVIFMLCFTLCLGFNRAFSTLSLCLMCFLLTQLIRVMRRHDMNNWGK